MRASLILLFGKTKAFFGNDTARNTTVFLHMLFVENERETSKLKTIRPKTSLTSLLHAALQFMPSAAETEKDRSI